MHISNLACRSSSQDSGVGASSDRVGVTGWNGSYLIECRWMSALLEHTSNQVHLGQKARIDSVRSVFAPVTHSKTHTGQTRSNYVAFQNPPMICFFFPPQFPPFCKKYPSNLSCLLSSQIAALPRRPCPACCIWSLSQDAGLTECD